MNASIKAALLSALIFPGVGQLSLGKKIRGWLIIFVNCVFLYFILNEIIKQVSVVVEKVQRSDIAFDYESISNKTSELMSFSDNSFLNTLLILLILTWFISVIDAYILGENNFKKY